MYNIILHLYTFMILAKPLNNQTPKYTQVRSFEPTPVSASSKSIYINSNRIQKSSKPNSTGTIN